MKSAPDLEGSGALCSVSDEPKAGGRHFQV